MKKRRKWLNILILCMIGVLFTERVIAVVANFIVSRTNGAEGLVTLAQVNQMVNYLLFYSFFVLLTINVIHELMNWKKASVNIFAIISLLLFIGRNVFSIVYVLYINHLINKEVAGAVSEYRIGDYLRNISLVNGAVGLLFYFIIGILTILTLKKNHTMVENAE